MMNREMAYEQPLTPFEQRLRDDVIYLHSLWHQGPPNLTSNPNPNPNPNPDPNFSFYTLKPTHYTNNPSRNLHVSHATSFKKTIRNKPTNLNNNNNIILPSGSVSYPLPEYPLLQMQQKIVKSCNEFLSKRCGSGSCQEEGKNEDDGEEKEEDSFLNDDVESEEFNFFFSFFVGQRDLRDYYEKNQESGDFYCLVCGGMEMFKGCVCLAQHTIEMSSQKKAHRAFGLVICRVLGWDITRLPMIVLKGEPLSQSLTNLGNTLNCLKNDDSKKDVDNRVSDPSQVSDVQWECNLNPVDECPSSGWPTLNPETLLVKHAAALPEELARFSMLQLQQRFVEKCKSLLSTLCGPESDQDEESDDDSMDDEDMSEESKEFKLFLRLFTEDNELRDFYENHYEDGEFCCIVCGVIGKKVWKRFKGCAGLLQHSTAISKTKKKRAHRAFGQVICKVLGWDVDRLPTIVLKGEPLSRLLANYDMLQNTLNEDDNNASISHLELKIDESGAENFETGCIAREDRTETEVLAGNSGVGGVQGGLNH